MKRLGSWIIAAFALLGSVSPCSARESATIATFESINQRVQPPAPEFVHAIALQAVRDKQRERGSTCVPSDITVEPLRPATADRLILRAIDDGILANAFTATAIQLGCGDDALPAQLMIFALPSGKAKARFTGLGRTFAWFSLINDAQEPVTMAAILKLYGAAPECKDPLQLERFELVDTDEVGPEVFGVRYKGQWSERWHFTSCKQHITVPIKFITDGKGGAHISVDIKDVAVSSDED